MTQKNRTLEGKNRTLEGDGGSKMTQKHRTSFMYVPLIRIYTSRKIVAEKSGNKYREKNLHDQIVQSKD